MGSQLGPTSWALYLTWFLAAMFDDHSFSSFVRTYVSVRVYTYMDVHVYMCGYLNVKVRGQLQVLSLRDTIHDI